MSGSRNQRDYLRLRAEGVAVDAAEFEAGIVPGEGKLIDAALARGELEIPDPAAGVDTTLEPQISAISIPDSSAESTTRRPGQIGHNSGDNSMANGTVAAEALSLFIERIERVGEEIKGLQDDRKDIYAEAKAQGYDAAAMRAVIKLRAMEKDVRDERSALIETYAEALGLYIDTPLGAYAMSRAA